MPVPRFVKHWGINQGLNVCFCPKSNIKLFRLNVCFGRRPALLYWLKFLEY